MSISHAGRSQKVSPLLNSMLPSECYVSLSPILKIQNHLWVQENAFSVAKIGSDKIASLKIRTVQIPTSGKEAGGEAGAESGLGEERSCPCSVCVSCGLCEIYVSSIRHTCVYSELMGVSPQGRERGLG